MQLPWEGCNVSICVLIQKVEINSTGHCRAKAINRLMPVQTVNYETGERVKKEIPVKTLIKTYLAYLLYLNGLKKQISAV